MSRINFIFKKMFMISQKNNKYNKFKSIFLGIFLSVLILAPFFAFSSHRSDFYVNTKASGEKNGSKDHPFETINDALDKADGKKANIHVAKGEYKENITLEKGIKLFGENKDNTIIKAKKDKWATVFIENDAEINGFTIKNGKRGIWVDDNAESKIVDCIIKDNNEEGIYIEAGEVSESNQVIISNTKVKENDYKGIRAVGARKVVITDNEIYGNKNDGIDLASGTKGWIAENSIRENGGSGMKLVLDGSEIWTRRNDIRENKREGIETASYGGAGRINIDKSKIVKNGLYGIARLQRAGYIDWGKNLTFGGIMPELWGNTSGTLSNVIYIK